MELRLILMALVCLCIAQMAFASEGSLKFDESRLEQRYVILSKEIRCSTCKNQNVFDSNSQIAVDMRHKIYTLLQEGQSDTDVREYLVQRYGSYILFNPPWQSSTYMLWCGPALMLLVGLGGFYLIVTQRKRTEVSMLI